MNNRQIIHWAWQDLRQRHVKVMLMALVIAIATVATINGFAEHLQRTLASSASAFLAADRQIDSRSGQPIPDAWLRQATAQGLETGGQIQFTTMVSSETAFQLVSVKAVSENYPLRGLLDWQADLYSTREQRDQGPAPGTIWLSPRLLSLLDVEIGDALTVGAVDLHVAGLIVREPDSGFRLSDFSPRVMMHIDDVPATRVIQPGSRVRYKALLAGDEMALESFYQSIEASLTPDYRWLSPRESDTLAESLQRAEKFLQLGGSLAILLAVVAIAVASREYALSQQDTVALLKTLGCSRADIRRSYLLRLLIWGSLSALLGLMIAVPAAWGLALLTAQMLGQTLQFQVTLHSVVPALLTGLVALFAFAFPPINRLRKLSAMRALRSLPVGSTHNTVIDTLLAIIVICLLLSVTVGDLKLVAALLAAVTALTALLFVIGWLILKGLKRLPVRQGSFRLALIALYRHRYATLSQLTVFAMTVMLAATLLLVRSSLLADWQAQIPEQAPNHFLMNIAADNQSAVETFFAERQIAMSPMYPIVRGRLTHINEQPAQQVAVDPDNDELRRELNLTTAVDYPEDNRIVAGSWRSEGDAQGVSLEQSLAEALGVGIGDTLTFSIGGETIVHPVTSIRTVQWDTMQPNFFIIFPAAEALQGLPRTLLTSFYLAPEDKAVLNTFVRQFPTISVLEVDHIIEQIQQIVRQVTQAVEAILLMILLAAIAVMFAVVSATLAERQREGALLRTLGGQQKMLVRATLIEFALIGLLAGILGSLTAELALWALQAQLFDGAFRWHWTVLLTLPLASAVLLALLGRWQLTPVLTISPMRLLRKLE